MPLLSVKHPQIICAFSIHFVSVAFSYLSLYLPLSPLPPTEKRRTSMQLHGKFVYFYRKIKKNSFHQQYFEYEKCRLADAVQFTAQHPLQLMW